MARFGDVARRVQRRRDKLRAAGLRPVQIWVPDTRAPGFAEECARQCRIIAENPDPELDAGIDALNQELLDDLDRLES